MHRKLIASATILLLLMLTAIPACAAYCTACGITIADSAHLCPRCGARQMPSTSALTVTRIIGNGDGTVSVRWSGGSGPYTIHCVQMLSTNIHDDLQNSACMGLQPAATDAFTGYSGRADLLVPGQDYWIVVRDAKDRISYQPHIPGAAPAFTAFPVGLTLQPPGGDGTGVTLSYPLLTSPREYTALLCITAPNGAVCTVAASPVTLPAGSSALPFPGCNLTDCFRLPTGTYTLTLFLDGMCASQQTFCIAD